jgi:hypothetical protein
LLLYIEDILAFVNSREELVRECCELLSLAPEFLSTEIQNLLEDADFLNSTPGFLPQGKANREDFCYCYSSGFEAFTI